MSDRALVLLSLASWAGFAIIVMALDRFASGPGRRPRLLRFLAEDRGDGWEPITRDPSGPSWTTTQAGARIDWAHLGEPGPAIAVPSVLTEVDRDDEDGADEDWADDDVGDEEWLDDDGDDVDDAWWDLPDVVDDNGFAFDPGTEFGDDELTDDDGIEIAAALEPAAATAPTDADPPETVEVAQSADTDSEVDEVEVGGEVDREVQVDVDNEVRSEVGVAVVIDTDDEVEVVDDVAVVSGTGDRDDDTGPLAAVHVLDPSSRSIGPDPFFSELIRRLSDRVAETVRLETRQPAVSSADDDAAPPAIDREAATG